MNEHKEYLLEQAISSFKHDAKNEMHSILAKLELLKHVLEEDDKERALEIIPEVFSRCYKMRDVFLSDDTWEMLHRIMK